eukprot:FR743362.1.p1 GENE.FR743362.1~~FR743362.1.p1  ORF type:complete len:168 (-),score=22.82 FR743362.1:68-571(-)
MLVVLLVTVVLPGPSFTLAMTMFVVLFPLGMYSYLKPCLNRHEDRMMTLFQGCTFFVLLAPLMVKPFEGLPGGVADPLFWGGTLFPVGACIYIVLSEIREYRKHAKLLAEAEKAEKDKTPFSIAPGHGSASSFPRSSKPEPMTALPIAPATRQVEPPEHAPEEDSLL